MTINVVNGDIVRIAFTLENTGNIAINYYIYYKFYKPGGPVEITYGPIRRELDPSESQTISWDWELQNFDAGHDYSLIISVQYPDGTGVGSGLSNRAIHIEVPVGEFSLSATVNSPAYLGSYLIITPTATNLSVVQQAIELHLYYGKEPNWIAFPTTVDFILDPDESDSYTTDEKIPGNALIGMNDLRIIVKDQLTGYTFMDEIFPDKFEIRSAPSTPISRIVSVSYNHSTKTLNYRLRNDGIPGWIWYRIMRGTETIDYGGGGTAGTGGETGGSTTYTYDIIQPGDQFQAFHYVNSTIVVDDIRTL